APPQLVERKGRVHPARIIEVAVDQTIQQMPYVEPAAPPGRVGVSNDIQCAVVAEEMVPFRLIGELVDPLDIDQKKPAGVFGRCIEPIEKHAFPAVIGSQSYDIALVPNHVKQLELLEERGEWIEILPHLRPRFD